MNFDPDKYIKENIQTAPSSGFNPDEYIKKIQQPVESVSPRPTNENLEDTDPSVWASIKSLPGKALEGAEWFGEKQEKYSGAPTRAALYELLKNKSIPGAIEKGWSQFGADPTLAPSGEDIAADIGGLSRNASKTVVPEHIARQLGKPYTQSEIPGQVYIEGASPAKMAGLPIEMAADVTNLLPVGEMAKVGFKGAKLGAEAGLGVGKLGIKAAGKGIEATGELGKKFVDGVKATFDTVHINPKLEQHVATAIKHGIDPELLPDSVKFGKDSVLDKIERGRADINVKGARPKLVEFQTKLNDAYNNEVSKLNYGKPVPNKEEAGKVLRDAYNQRVEELFNDNEVRYSTLADKTGIKEVPQSLANKTYNKLDEVKDKILRELKFENDTVSRNNLNKTLEAIDRMKDNMLDGDFKTFITQMQYAGKSGAKHSPFHPDGTPINKYLSEIHKQMRDDVLKIADFTGHGDDLRSANKEISEFLKDAEHISAVTDKNVAPEKLFDELVTRGNSLKLDGIRKIIGDNPDAMGAIKAAYIQSLTKTGTDSNILFNSLRKKVANDHDAKRVLEYLFDPKELTGVNDVLDLSEDFSGIKLNKSETNVSRSLITDPKGTLSGVAENVIAEDLLKRKTANEMKGILSQKPLTPKVQPKGGVMSFVGNNLNEQSRADMLKNYLTSQAAKKNLSMQVPKNIYRATKEDTNYSENKKQQLDAWLQSKADKNKESKAVTDTYITPEQAGKAMLQK